VYGQVSASMTMRCMKERSALVHFASSSVASMADRSKNCSTSSGVRVVVCMINAGPPTTPSGLRTSETCIRWSSGRWSRRRVCDLSAVKSVTKAWRAGRGMRSIIRQVFWASFWMESWDMVVQIAAFIVWTASTSQPRRGTPSSWRSRRRVWKRVLRRSSSDWSLIDGGDDDDGDDDDSLS